MNNWRSNYSSKTILTQICQSLYVWLGRDIKYPWYSLWVKKSSKTKFRQSIGFIYFFGMGTSKVPQVPKHGFCQIRYSWYDRLLGLWKVLYLWKNFSLPCLLLALLSHLLRNQLKRDRNGHRWWHFRRVAGRRAMDKLRWEEWGLPMSLSEDSHLPSPHFSPTAPFSPSLTRGLTSCPLGNITTWYYWSRNSCTYPLISSGSLLAFLENLLSCYCINI